TSSLRQLEGGKVTTLVGTGQFDFGFRDGLPGRALMQHPLGVFALKDAVYLADTLNYAVRKFDPITSRLDTVTSGELRAPSGLSGTKGLLYVADRDHHAVQVIDLKNKLSVPLLLDDSSSSERVLTAERQLSEELPQVRILPEIQVASEKNLT